MAWFTSLTNLLCILIFPACCPSVVGSLVCVNSLPRNPSFQSFCTNYSSGTDRRPKSWVASLEQIVLSPLQQKEAEDRHQPFCGIFAIISHFSSQLFATILHFRHQIFFKSFYILDLLYFHQHCNPVQQKLRTAGHRPFCGIFAIISHFSSHKFL